MKLRSLFANPASLLILAACAVTLTLPAHADTIVWTNWSSGVAGNPGGASGSIGSITVTYTGQTTGLTGVNSQPSWLPTSSFTSSIIDNGPLQSDNAISIQGGQPYTETIQFSSALVNPVLAIWSHGQSNDPTTFNFTDSEPFSIVAGGPSSEYGGSSITQSKSLDDVIGVEGNGVIQFSGTYTSITFTTPLFENYYAFTVGEDQTAQVNATSSVVPEPATLSLFGMGLAALPFARRALTRKR